MIRTFQKTNVDDNSRTRLVAKHPASLSRGIPDQLYVYSDIVEPYSVGDTQAPLLRIVHMASLNYHYGNFFVSSFEPVHYVSLMRHNIQNIVIDIRNVHGKPIPFEYGTLTVSLHFKRVK